jgi:hypothetical protein
MGALNAQGIDRLSDGVIVIELLPLLNRLFECTEQIQAFLSGEAVRPMDTTAQA